MATSRRRPGPCRSPSRLDPDTVGHLETCTGSPHSPSTANCVVERLTAPGITAAPGRSSRSGQVVAHQPVEPSWRPRAPARCRGVLRGHLAQGVGASSPAIPARYVWPRSAAASPESSTNSRRAPRRAAGVDSAVDAVASASVRRTPDRRRRASRVGRRFSVGPVRLVEAHDSPHARSIARWIAGPQLGVDPQRLQRSSRARKPSASARGDCRTPARGPRRPHNASEPGAVGRRGGGGRHGGHRPSTNARGRNLAFRGSHRRLNSVAGVSTKPGNDATGKRRLPVLLRVRVRHPSASWHSTRPPPDRRSRPRHAALSIRRHLTPRSRGQWSVRGPRPRGGECPGPSFRHRRAADAGPRCRAGTRSTRRSPRRPGREGPVDPDEGNEGREDPISILWWP